MDTQTVELVREGALVVEKKYNLSYEEFAEKHLFGNYPVVIGDACAAWSAKNKFTPEFFKKHYSDRKVEISGKSYTLGEYIDWMLTGTEENPAPYPCTLQIERDYPELLPDVLPRFKYALPDRINSKLLPKRFLSGANTLEIFFGSPGAQFPYVHYDYMCLHAYITQLYGEKEFTVIPPDQTPYVYPRPDNLWVSQVDDIWNPDLEKYPLFAKTTPIKFVVGPGETLFIPCGWWHTARSLTPTISVALDCLNGSNWKNFMNEVDMNIQQRRPKLAGAVQTYLSVIGSVLGTVEKMA
ncbi:MULTISPECIES: cupin-like domain-containing protein [unclassified Spirosoma]|uniref:cupin-like domain-containing protein n=1 Tax=unclassified Spirosoma TaxID=2621999 RepID=UPI00095EF4FC|nr:MULTISPECIES: cupin-like domain-containing protein [unclassified Spirosoma]MBN8824799.1 cupin-like domain-containing protein [Spirosoma sp.]OJW77050.1 MAG: transcription factor jumonji [Spirosoma sp. 48-14]